MGKVSEVPSSSSFSQARKKIKPEFYEFLNTELVNDYYETYIDEEDIKRGYYRGRRLLGLDGSIINLPDTEETRIRYSIQSNQKSGKERVQALGSFLYDLNNELVISVSLKKRQSEEKFLYTDHKKALKSGDIITMDRVYASYRMLSYCRKTGVDYVIRFPSQSFKEVNNFWKSTDDEQVVEIQMRDTLTDKDGLLKSVKLRLIKVELPTGEIEVLGTSLLDIKEFPKEEFSELYNKRWGIETYFNRIKNIYEVERFSGTSIESILQDFYGIIFLSNLESMISKEAEEEINEKLTREKKSTEYKVNHSVSYSAMIDYTTELFVDESREIEEVLEELKYFLKKNPILKREGRQCERKELTVYEKLWHQKYGKKINP